jgi:tryptophan synthase alpha chain
VKALAETTRALRARGRKALVAYFTAGYPDDDAFDALVRTAADAGADVVEVGIPFSDPIADGPVIQSASNAALARGVTLARALETMARLAPHVEVPLVVMSYVNPILRLGVDAFAREAARAGAAGVILPDVAFEESAAFRPAMRNAGLAYIDLVAPTSGDARVNEIARASDGFVYVVSITGVTGARAAARTDVAGIVARVRAATDTPAYVGFGVSTPDAAAEVASASDGVIIGSRLVQLAGEGPAQAAAGRVGDFLASVRRALDG